MIDLFEPGERVEIHPACDLWMMGARYGNVVSCGRKYVWVQLDKIAKPVGFHPFLLTPLPRPTLDEFKAAYAAEKAALEASDGP